MHTHIAKLLRTTKGDNMANGKVPTELTIEGVTLVFGEEMPDRTRGKSGTSKYDAIVEAIRSHPLALAGQPVRLDGVKPSGVSPLKKRYSDINFETRGGKENPSVWATIKSTEEEMTSA
jgi:hypothetical protein